MTIFFYALAVLAGIGLGILFCYLAFVLAMRDIRW